MKTIYKYWLNVVDHQVLKLPAGSKILSVTEQSGDIVLYALIDTEVQTTENYHIDIRGTGHPADSMVDSTFLGTVKIHNGILMFHVFYKKESETENG